MKAVAEAEEFIESMNIAQVTSIAHIVTLQAMPWRSPITRHE